MTISTIYFFVNGKAITLNNPDPELTLTYYIRNTLRLTGTKLGCEEGACGACTVVLGKHDENHGKVVYQAVNACLVPIYMIDRCSVITVEGISKDRIHPIQERLAKGHGTQCGFCSPGFTMAMYALLRNKANPSMEEINQAIKGNLCRCTGYRPIMEAFYSFSDNPGGCCGGGKDGKCPCKEGDEPALAAKLTTFTEMPKYDPTQEIIFPPQLSIKNKSPVSSLFLKGYRLTVYAPTSLNEVVKIAKEIPDHKIISSGMISRLVLGLSAGQDDVTWISLHRIPELEKAEVADGKLVIGSALSLGQLQAFVYENHPNGKELLKIFKKYSAEQVKNTASWAGALTSAAAASDFCTLSLATNSYVHIFSLEDQSRKRITVEQLFHSSGKTSLKPSEIITAIEFDANEHNVRYFSYKQGERRGADSTIVNGVMRVEVDGDQIKSARLVVGVDKKPQLLEAFGHRFENKSIPELSSTFDDWSYDLGTNFDSSMPDFHFRMSLVKSFLLDTINHLAKGDEYKNLEINTDDFEFLQLYQQTVDNGVDACGRPLAHQFADRHAMGEAKYVNDLKFEGLLHGAPVLSTEAHAEVLSIDPSDALAIAGVVAYLDERDIPKEGTNTPAKGHLCLVNDDTRVFAAGKVEEVGQVIGMIVAEDVVTARRAAKLVQIEYKKLPAILTIDEAKEAKSYICDPLTFGKEEEEVQSALNGSQHQISGEVSIGGQEHIYMETQSSVVVPTEDKEFTIHTSSQGVAIAQISASVLLGIPSNNFTVKIRRVGGAFGGKAITQCGFARNPALVAANKLKRPVSVVLHRNDDVLITGKRHPVKCQYKVAFSADGKIEAVYFTSFVDAGWSTDNSVWVSNVIGSLATTCFKIPIFRSQVHVLKTNKQSNTAFRGYGQPQVYFIMDAIVNHVAQELGMNFEEVKELNFARVGDIAWAGSAIRNDGMLECWEECKRLAEWEKVQREVEQFNNTSPHIKRGVAMATTRFGMPHAGPLEAGSALVQICYDGAVSVSIGGVEMGQGLNVKIQQCASRALGLPIERINLLEVGSDKTINAPVTGGSQGADIHGKAVQKCCEKLLEGLKPFLEKANGDWNTAVFQAYCNKVQLQASEFITIEREQHGLHGHDPCYYTSGACCVLAELDTLTGEHKLLAVDIVMDCGESLNPAIDIGQIEGGFMQGYGLMTCEQLVYNEKGRLLTDTAYKYKIPTVQMVPDKFRVKLLDGISTYPEQIYRSKGVGEPPLMLGSAVHTALLKAIIAKRNPTKPLIFDAPFTAKQLYKHSNEE
ncbi:unnamed protein product, partial [Mesorhabditis belari]|uniref:Xanthine dehydrogenase n=1 Tax=Mesorhabditis belari TaxID=2138241 RepID=A0AAF3FSI0_9BILA